MKSYITENEKKLKNYQYFFEKHPIFFWQFFFEISHITLHRMFSL